MATPLTGTPLGGILYALGIGADARQARQARRVDEEMKNYLDAPESTITNVMQADPWTGLKLAQDYTDRTRAAEDRQRKQVREDTTDVTRYLRGLPQDTDFGAAIDELTPYFTQTLGITPGAITNFRQAVVTNPSILAGLDDDAFKEIIKDRYNTTVITPGSKALRQGKVVAEAPFARQTVATSPGQSRDVFDPNTGEFLVDEGAPAAPSAAAPAAGGAPLSVEALRPHFVAQESRGNYRARNAETGALGAYQIMPATGRALAQRVGMPWRPDMMTKDDPASRRYQDALGTAAIQEAIDASGGDLATAAMYYHGGSNRNIWGPKTQQYAREIEARVGGAPAEAQSARSRHNISVAPKATASVRTLSPEEVAAAGFEPGTVVQQKSDGTFSVKQKPSASSKKAGAGAGGKPLFDSTIVDGALSSVDDALRNVEYAGPRAKMWADIPIAGAWMGREERQSLEAALEQIQGMNVVSLIQAIQNSGASVARLMDARAESQRLSAALSSLSAEQSPEQLRSNLAKARAQLTKLRDTARAAEREGASGGQIIRDAQGNRYRYKGSGDTADIKNYERL